MNFPRVRLNYCRKCASPCALNGDAGALARPEAVCPLKTWQTLPVGIVGGNRVELRASVGTGTKPEEWGPAKWAELHTWALGEDFGMASERRAWLARFSASLPLCACRSHWASILAELVPPFAGDSGELFAWSVAAHNAVNRLKAKPEISVETALERWGVTAPTS